MHIKIAVIGATGNVGRKVVAMLLAQNIVRYQDLFLFASPRSSGQTMRILGQDFVILNTEQADFSLYTICIFNTESDISQLYVPLALEAGAYVIDSSSHYRCEPDVPLIIPPVNKSTINLKNKFYAHANCLVSPIATVIAPLHHFNPIRRINLCTYQSTSGAGKAASDECFNETAALVQGVEYKRSHFAKQIGFNVIPQVGAFMDDGMSLEEVKIIKELQKVVDQNIAITATAVRVPVLIGHSIALSIEFSQDFRLEAIYEILAQAASVQCKHQEYLTPIEVVDQDDVFVGRIRRDNSTEHGLHLWLCSDNLRRGAATDSVEIATELANKIKNNKAQVNKQAAEQLSC